MNRNRVGLAALVGAALVFFSPSAKAYVLGFNFESADFSIIGTIDITAQNTSPVAITALNAIVNGSDLTTLVPNPFPLTPHQTSPDGLWFYDNIGFKGNTHLDNDGLLFTAGGFEYNIYSDLNFPPDSRNESFINGYFIGQSVIGGTYVGDPNGQAGTLLITDPADLASSVPELSTWTMMLLGFASIGFFAYNRAKKTAVVTA